VPTRNVARLEQGCQSGNVIPCDEQQRVLNRQLDLFCAQAGFACTEHEAPDELS
jgi:hypothetical protein